MFKCVFKPKYPKHLIYVWYTTKVRELCAFVDPVLYIYVSVRAVFVNVKSKLKLKPKVKVK